MCLTSPCYKCKDRKLGCHSKCEKYAKFQYECDKVRKRKIEIAEFKDYRCQVFTNMYKRLNNKWVSR